MTDEQYYRLMAVAQAKGAEPGEVLKDWLNRVQLIKWMSKVDTLKAEEMALAELEQNKPSLA